MNILPYSELNVNGLGKNRLLPIIDTLRKMGGRSGEFALKLGTLDDARAAFKKFKEYAVHSTLGEARVLKALNTLNIVTAADFKEFLLDQDYGRILLSEVPKMQIKLTGANNGKRGRIAGRHNTRTVRSMSEVYNIFGYTWDEEEALEKGDWNEKDVWVIRTNRQDLPTLFVYPKEKYEEDDIKEMISKYEHRLATLYKYELRDSSVNAYWLARPCTYRHWLKHPIPDKSERIDPDETDMNKNNNIKYNMNTSLNRDRNTLKRLVESYGKKDVLNFVRHLNEGFFNSKESRTIILSGIDIKKLDGPFGILEYLDNYRSRYNKNVSINGNVVSIEYSVPTRSTKEQFDEFSSFYKCFDVCYRSIPAVRSLIDYYTVNGKHLINSENIDNEVIQINKLQSKVDKFVSREEVQYINYLADRFGVLMSKKLTNLYKFQKFIDKILKKYSIYDRFESRLDNTQRSLISNARIKHMNESFDGDSLKSILKSCKFFIDEPYGYGGFSGDGSDFGEFYDAKISGDTLELYIDGPEYGFDEDFLEDFDSSYYTAVIRFDEVNPVDKENIKNILSSISYIVVYIVDEDNEIYQCDKVTALKGDKEDYNDFYPGADYELNLLASKKI